MGRASSICEIQQNSNCTYRVYDYDRRGADGKPRPLHIDKALDVCTLEPSDTASHLGPVLSCAGGTAQKLGECAYFSTQKLRVEEALTLEAGGGELPLLGVRRGRRAAVRAGEHPGIHGGGEPAGARGHGEGVPCAVTAPSSRPPCRGRRKDRHRQGGYTMKIILMGEPMGLFMANETGSLSEVNTFTASIAGAEYNVAVGLARLGHTPAYCHPPGL